MGSIAQEESLNVESLHRYIGSICLIGLILLVHFRPVIGAILAAIAVIAVIALIASKRLTLWRVLDFVIGGIFIYAGVVKVLWVPINLRAI